MAQLVRSQFDLVYLHGQVTHTVIAVILSFPIMVFLFWDDILLSGYVHIDFNQQNSICQVRDCIKKTVNQANLDATAFSHSFSLPSELFEPCQTFDNFPEERGTGSPKCEFFFGHFFLPKRYQCEATICL